MTDPKTAYEKAVGVAALARQEQLARERFTCCGERREDGHHEVCAKRPKDEIVPQVAGQTSLV